MRHYYFQRPDLKTMTPLEIASLADMVENHPEMHSVYFDKIHLSGVNVSILKPIFIAVRNNQNISKVSFNNTGAEFIEENDIDLLYSSVKDKHCVHFSQNQIYGDCPGVQLVIRLATSNIHKFFCEINSFGAGRFKAFNGLMNAFSKSEFELLSLLANEIGARFQCDVMLSNLFRSKIKCIILDSNPLGRGTFDIDWEDIINILRENKYLKKLSLKNCSLDMIECEGEGVFAEQLVSYVKNTNLEELNISDNHFSKELTTELVKASVENPKLILALEGNAFSLEEINSIKLSLLDPEAYEILIEQKNSKITEKSSTTISSSSTEITAKISDNIKNKGCENRGDCMNSCSII